MSGEASDVDQRPHRSPVLLTASLEAGETAIDVKLRNISEGGALVESDFLPRVCSAVVFRRQSTTVGGVVAWVNGRLAGIQFDRPLNTDELLRHIKRPPPVVEADPEAYKRPGLRNHNLTLAERAWLERWMQDPGHGRFGD